MLSCRIYATDIDIDERLRPFGVTRAELFPIIQAVVAARADAVDDDPVTAAGQFAYIYGTRHVRAVLQRKKYLRYREHNIEGVKHPDRDLKIIYQSVDIAALDKHWPQAISGKGSAVDRMIDAGQRDLFTREELARLNPVTIAPVNKGAWFFCVSVNGDDVRAELSLPATIEGGNFKNFIERIYILRGDEWASLKAAPKKPDEGVAEFEPTVTRRR